MKILNEVAPTKTINVRDRPLNSWMNNDIKQTFQNHYGICDSVLDWISSYLSPRWCSVTINNHCSDLKQLDVSVPQGLCSGAYFFIMYAATLFTEISHERSAELFGFADDHILYDVFSADSRV